jgi:hypothetical protein
MSGFFSRARFGQPQFLAGILLLVFLAQCLWLASRGFRAADGGEAELARIHQGLAQWQGKGIAGTPYCATDQRPLAGAPAELGNSGAYDPHHSPLWYLTASAPLLLWPASLHDSMRYWGWLTRTPYLIFGLLLGASLWYVSRRLYGNMGGYIALTLYCFSPAILRASALWFAQPEMGAAWGAFGAIFTAIAMAHTLYAPREVILWNWRRMALLGLALALAVGSQFSLVIVLPLALGFMLYLAPNRRGAALIIWAAACAMAGVLIFSSYFFHPQAFWDGMRQARFFGLAWRAFGMAGAYRQVLAQVGQSSPALVFAFPAAIVAFLAWPRSRYFGNLAPLIVAALFLFLAVGAPHYPGLGFQLMALPFMFVFVAGVAADLLETRQRALVLACVWGLLSAQALWNLWELARIAA